MQGYALEKLIAARAQLDDPDKQVVAKVRLWQDHNQMLDLATEALAML